MFSLSMTCHLVTQAAHATGSLEKLVTDHKVTDRKISYRMMVSYCMIVSATLQPANL